MPADESACTICLDASQPPIQSGCACRGDGGLAHIACLVRAAASQQAQRGSDAWRQCQTCKQGYTGAMQTGLAEAWRSRVAGQAAESFERIEAESNLAVSLLHQGKGVEAEPMFRRLHAVLMRVHGAEHPRTLTTANNLAQSLAEQGKYADAERIEREVHGVEKRLLGPEHPSTLTSANNLSMFLSYQGKYADAERIEREVLGVRKRVLPRGRAPGGHAGECGQSGYDPRIPRQIRGGRADAACCACIVPARTRTRPPRDAQDRT